MEICTGDHKGTFLSFVKECVLELPGSEVSSDNISQVIRSVIKHIMDVDIPLKDLPSKQAMVNISDCPVSTPENVHSNTEHIKESSCFGIMKDGTNRQKKILISSVKLQNGQELPLGFTMWQGKLEKPFLLLCKRS